MTAMFPDSGAPASDARNSMAAPNTVNCSPLWYSTSRCQPRFDPAAANAVLSELIHLINIAGIPYDCTVFNNLDQAVRKLIQCGKEYGGNMAYSAGNYSSALLPPLTAYCPWMLFKGVPDHYNDGVAYLNLGPGYRQILRNDGQSLQKNDLIPGMPQLFVYFNDNWYIPYPVPSQIPRIFIGSVDAWVRTDGNDTTGDGTANSPEKAFRTIKRAYEVNTAKYVVTSQFTLAIRLGIPGVYEGTSFDGFVGTLYLMGDTTQPQNYRISSYVTATESRNIAISAARVILMGFTMLLDRPSSFRHWCLTVGGPSNVSALNLRFEALTSNTNSIYVVVSSGALLGMYNATFVGNSASVATIISVQGGAAFGFGETGTIQFLNIAATVSYEVTRLSQFTVSGSTVIANSCTGQKYGVDFNSIATLGSQPVPGSTPGTVATGGQVTGGALAREGEIRIADEDFEPPPFNWAALPKPLGEFANAAFSPILEATP